MRLNPKQMRRFSAPSNLKSVAARVTSAVEAKTAGVTRGQILLELCSRAAITRVEWLIAEALGAAIWTDSNMAFEHQED